MADDAPPALPLVVFDATWQAKPLIKLLESTRAVGRSVAFRHFEQPGALAAFLASSDPDLSRLVAVWQQVTDFWRTDLWEPPAGLPGHVRVTRFPFLEGRCFWPLAGTDPRNRGEPPLYPDGRYRFSDHVVASLAGHDGDETALYDRYLEDSIRAFGDLDAQLIAEIASMAARDALCDVRFTILFVQQYQRVRLFHSGGAPSGIAYGWLGAGLAERLAPWLGKDPGSLSAAVQQQAAGLQGIGQFQDPIHPEVARRFGLQWASKDSWIRFGKNRWDHRTAILRAVRWDPWAP